MKLKFFRQDYTKLTPPEFSASERRGFVHHVREVQASPVVHDTMRATWCKGSPKFRTAKRRKDTSGNRIPTAMAASPATPALDPFIEARSARLARNAARIATKASDLKPNWADKRSPSTPLSLDDL